MFVEKGSGSNYIGSGFIMIVSGSADPFLILSDPYLTEP